MICGKNRKSIFLLLCILALSLNWYCIAPVFAGELPAADTESVSQDGSSGILQEEQEEQEESSGTSVADPPPDDPVTPPDDSSTPPDNPVTPPDSPVTPPDLPDNPDPPAENYTVVLDTMTVSEGEYIGYTVISPEFAGGSAAGRILSRKSDGSDFRPDRRGKRRYPQHRNAVCRQ